MAKPSGIGGAMRGLPHEHQWIEVRHAPQWMSAYGLSPADDYRLCWACGAIEALEPETAEPR